MRTLFKERRLHFTKRCLSYLRYVLNDHFVLVLMVLLGFLALQYRALLEHFPDNLWTVYLLLGIVSILSFLSGRVATYIEEPDRIFLLAKEEEVFFLLKQSRLRAMIVWGSGQVVVQVLFLPLYLKLGWTLPGFALYLLLLSIGKYAWFVVQTPFISKEGRLDWDNIIQYEKKRKQKILQFYSLFTHVKGISNHVKRRKHLDVILHSIKKQQSWTWDYLFARSLLRTGDFFWLMIRLVSLSLVSLALVQESWLAVGLVVLFDYLLLFQLLSLYQVYDYQYMTQLYPLTIQDKTSSFVRLIRLVMSSIVALQLVVGIWLLQERYYLVGLVGAGICLIWFYLGVKSRKLID